MTRLTALLNRHVVPALTALSENTYMSAIRAGMVSVVPLTIIGGLFLVISYLPVPGWAALVEPWLSLLQIPVTATFGACLQNNHHHYPWLLRNSHDPAEYDFGFVTIRALNRLGLVTASSTGADWPPELADKGLGLGDSRPTESSLR